MSGIRRTDWFGRMGWMVLLTLLFVSGWIQEGEATTLVRLSEEDLIDQADVIVTGRCVEVAPRWQGRFLMTAAVIEVSEQLKGEGGDGLAGHRLTVLIPGGVDPDHQPPLTMTVAGAPELDEGQDLLLYLTDPGDGSGNYFITGFSQGCYVLRPDTQGRTMASRNLNGVGLAGEDGVAAGSARTAPLEEIAARIAARLEGGAR